MRRAVLLAVVLAAAGAAPQLARADGDPASDYLLVRKVFLSYELATLSNQEQALTKAVATANKNGYAIRVAVIASSYDLGSVTVLWRKPQTYARFLGAELGFVYKQRLLVVMPNGFGFNWPKHDPTSEYRLIAAIPTGPRPLQLLTAASTAVSRLAAAGGVAVAPPRHVTNSAQGNTDDRVIIIVAVVGALALAGAARFFLRRRPRT